MGEEGALCEPWPGGRVREEVRVRVPPDSALDFCLGDPAVYLYLPVLRNLSSESSSVLSALVSL